MNKRSYQKGLFSYFNELDGPNFAACHLCLVKRHLRVGYTTKTQEDTLKLCFLSLNIPHWRFNS